MKRLLTLFTFAFCLLPFTFAGEAAAAPNFDVPDVAKWEALRRGNLVQELGTKREDSIDLIGAALAPPADDSHKWYLTVVTTNNCRYCEKLKYDFLHDDHLRAWVNVEDPSKSTMHYQVRRVEDPTQRDWLKAIRPQLDKGGYPALVIQPPRSGEYGHGSTTVAILHGYDGDPEALSARLRRAIATYVREYSAQHGIRGEQVIGDEAPISGPPPFSIPTTPLDPTQPNGGPADWPSLLNPKPLTPDQIKALVPQAPPEFLLTVLQSQTTEPAQVLQQWQLYQLQQATPQQPAESAPVSWWSMIAALFSGGTLGGVASLVLLILRKLGTDKEVRDKINELLNNR